MDTRTGSVGSVLLVEDDDALRQSLEFLLAEYTDVDSARDSAEAREHAVQRLRLKQAPHDLLLIDLKLGFNENGAGCLEALRELCAYRQVPALAMTGQPLTAGLKRACRDAGFVGVLAKPFMFEDLEDYLAGGALLAHSELAQTPRC